MLAKRLQCSSNAFVHAKSEGKNKNISVFGYITIRIALGSFLCVVFISLFHAIGFGCARARSMGAERQQKRIDRDKEATSVDLNAPF